MATACEKNQDLESIILFDDTDADIKDDEEPPAVQQSSAAFNTQEVITVLERISGSVMRSEANFANAILKNTREKNCKLDRFVSAFVQAFETCSDTVKKYKTCSIQEIRLEKEFATLRSDKVSEVFNAWKELVGETQLPQSESSAVVYQHVLQHFWSCVALKKERGESGNESNILVGLKISGDASEREAIRQHAGWAIKRARDVINTGNKTASIKQCQGLPTRDVQIRSESDPIRSDFFGFRIK